MSNTVNPSTVLTPLPRQKGLDILKCICAFLVVCIHIPFGFKGGDYFLIVTRIAVPTFFMITGFFYNADGNRKKIWKQIRRIALLLITTTLMYFLWEVFWNYANGKDVADFLKSRFNPESVRQYFLYNRPLVGGHLWYLAALLYTLVVVAVLHKIRLFRFLYILAPVLIALDLILGTYSRVLLGRTYWYAYLRNYVFVGIPYFVLGNFIGKHKELLQKKFGGKNRRRTAIILSLLAVFSCIASVLEYHFLKKADLLGSRPNYIGTVFFTISAFLLSALFYTNKNTKSEALLSFVGRELSDKIYIYHPIVINLLWLLFSTIGVYTVYSFCAPIIVFVVTSLAVYIPHRIKKNK